MRLKKLRFFNFRKRRRRSASPNDSDGSDGDAVPVSEISVPKSSKSDQQDVDQIFMGTSPQNRPQFQLEAEDLLRQLPADMQERVSPQYADKVLRRARSRSRARLAAVRDSRDDTISVDPSESFRSFRSDVSISLSPGPPELLYHAEDTAREVFRGLEQVPTRVADMGANLQQRIQSEFACNSEDPQNLNPLEVPVSFVASLMELLEVEDLGTEITDAVGVAAENIQNAELKVPDLTHRYPAAESPKKRREDILEELG